MFKICDDRLVQRLSDGTFIPNNPLNRDWRKYQAWLAEGNTPQAADAPQAPTVDKRTAAIDALLTEQAMRADAPQAVKDYTQGLAR